jgi:hypothetical protein
MVIYGLYSALIIVAYLTMGLLWIFAQDFMSGIGCIPDGLFDYEPDNRCYLFTG